MSIGNAIYLALSIHGGSGLVQEITTTDRPTSSRTNPPRQDRSTPPTAPPKAAPPTSSEAADNDIVITGLVVPGEQPDNGVTSSVGGDPERVFENSRQLDQSMIFARCVSRIGQLDSIRTAIDGPPNRADTRFALGSLVGRNVSCHVAYNLAHVPEADVLGTGRQAMFDRGAVLDQVLQTYAPDLRLTRKQTSDPAVRARFTAREAPRNRWRLPLDYRYFEIALCMVREAPESAVRFVRAESGSNQSTLLGRRLIDNARICVGNARNVTVDPSEFRVYILDAVYRWAVAARAVESLIPTDAGPTMAASR